MNNYFIIAHRGITNYYNDNSLDSLLEIKNIKSQDIKLGIEFDIQITKDNQIILYHDQLFNNKKINQQNYNEIKNIDDKIIKLDDLLINFNNTDYLLDIEIKYYDSGDISNYLNNLVNIVNKYKVNYFYSSYSSIIVECLKAKGMEAFLISENLDEKNTDITSYDLFNKFNKIKGVYTLYNDNFKENIIAKILKNKDIKYLITDNVEKLIKYLSKEL